MRAAETESPAPTAKVEFLDGSKRPVGEAILRQTPNGVLITAHLRDLPPGEHGFHVHETGKCQPPFESAGGHFNPSTKAHGFENTKGAHAGDLPNLVVTPGSAEVKVELLAPQLSLEPGKPGSLVDGDGTALVVHAKADDYHTDPAGDSGARIACGVVERSGKRASAASSGTGRIER
jgi:Cu-Zn family superoxide dismutase